MVRPYCAKFNRIICVMYYIKVNFQEDNLRQIELHRVIVNMHHQVPLPNYLSVIRKIWFDHNVLNLIASYVIY
jgi:hypothetical protein